MVEFLRKHAATIVVAMVVAAVTAGGPALAGLRTHSSATAATPPAVTTGYKAGPVDLPATTGTIASLGLSAGKYVITASFQLTTSNPGLYSFCQLKAGTNVQHADEGTPASETYDFVTMHVTHTFTSAGSAKLRCNDVSASSNITASYIRITAVSVNKITKVSLG